MMRSKNRMKRPRWIWIIFPTFYYIAYNIISIYIWIGIDKIDGHPQILLQTPELVDSSFYEIHMYKKEEHYQTYKYKGKKNQKIPLTTTEVLPRSHPRDGARRTNKKPSHAQLLWSGEAIRPIFSTPEIAKIKTIELVIAYCRDSLTWIYNDVLNEIPNQKEATVRMTVLSKCKEEANLPHFIDDHRIKDVNLMKLPNLGGCDYAYAHFINHYISKASLVDADSSLILFIKDTPRTAENFHFPHHSGYRTVSEMIKFASAGEFICGIKTNCNASPYHDTKILNTFKIDDYVRVGDINKGVKKDRKDDASFGMLNGYKHLQNFHRRKLNWKFPNNNLTQVCYGGTFALPASRLLFLSNEPNERQIFKLMEESLVRNTTSSIEEHYIERTWAGILAKSLNEKEVALVRGMQRPKNGISLRYGGVWGALFGKSKSTCG